ncbi:MAG: hypothetical protein KIT84_25810 [Labilithrix sp.]|nr:hypothetical protein [Labilithrix sp.]MCW5814470.1 hypothetical protein [Labilithrix sp.]
MTKPLLLSTLALVSVTTVMFAAEREARADEATIAVAVPPGRFSDPPPPEPIRADDGLIAREPELYRSFLRLTLGPTALTTGKGLGYGVGLGADMGQGSVGARLSAAWLRGEGKKDDGTSTPTGDSVGIYSGEITLDLNKRGRIHPIIGMGAGVLHVSRPDHRSGFAGVGTGRFALEYALGLDDADVRVGANLTGGLIGPIDDEIRGLRGYVQTGLHLAIGF